MSGIFTDFAQIKEFIGANANNELHTIQPYLDDATRDYLMPVIGKETWDEVLTAFPDEMSAAQEALLPYLRNAIANFGYYLFADDAAVNITEYGLTQLEDQQTKSAYQWQVRQFKDRRWANGWNALEELARFLNKNKDDYPTWYSSDERVEWNRLPVWNTLIFKKYYRINSLGTLWTLHPTMKEIQETVLRPTITAELLDSVLDEIMEDAASSDNTDLMPYLQRVQVLGALKDVVMNAGYEFGKNGLQVATIEGTSQNSDKTANAVNLARSSMQAEFEKKYKQALAMLTNFLDANATAEKYPSYYEKYLNVSAAETEDNNTDKGLKFFG